MPKWTAPMLATLTDKRFSDPDWIYERKLDGERCLVFRDGHGARLMSRNRKRLDDTYPELVEAVEGASDARFVADGEVVAFEGDITSFARLQGRMQLSDPDEARTSGIKVYYYLFDLLHLDGYDLTGLPLATRKSLLKQLLSFKGPLRYTAHRREHGEKYHREACDKGWEGVIAKDAASAYAHSRSRSWLKFKCVHEQELVIGGYTEPKGSRKGFGALVVGFYRGKTLHYAGKVGTGFDDETLESLAKKLRQREQDECPFAEEHAAKEKGVHWVEPELVGQFGFTEWTREDRLRHPRFLGLRRDKPAKKVVKETPK
ncbi:MAG TPA: non-homologous end-joining DNA ligase [Pelomicrobium sp.]|nr:non-homologous end-joining DNA ligase [Pelomicrobium sp.]